jgi:hypothetical protein
VVGCEKGVDADNRSVMLRTEIRIIPICCLHCLYSFVYFLQGARGFTCVFVNV